jgi:hydroxyethylthiazole kinase-like uncharacterized protein yjeF
MSTRTAPPRLVAVVDASGSSALDARGIAAGIPSRALMQRAGAAAAALIAREYGDDLASGVAVVTGPGNNGGDGWVVAHALHAVGIPVRVTECVAARSPDAVAERAIAVSAGVPVTEAVGGIGSGGERIIVDALLGTGLDGTRALQGAIAEGVARMRAAREAGVRIVALDVPSGLDASTGADAGSVRADLTVTFASIKRGHLVGRGRCGRIVVVDIGLGAFVPDDAMALVSEAWFQAMLPPIAADANKGTRGKIAIIGGAAGMGGAVVLAARGALRSGAGMVKCIVADESLGTVREAEPSALTASWPADDAAMRDVVTEWADVVLIGPGLGREVARAMVERVLAGFPGPVVIDADALNAFANEPAALRALIGGRAALLTPHAVEFARLAGLGVDAVLARRFDLPATLAASIGAAVLLKGVPTIVAGVNGMVRCVAEGTPVLATGGSGDLLGGIAATLLAQTNDAALAGALAAFAHGRAARPVSARQVRGFTLDDVVAALPEVWRGETSSPRPPILAQLEAVGEEDR